MYNRSVHCIRSVCVCVCVCMSKAMQWELAEGRVIALCEREDPLFVGLWWWVGEQVVLCNPYPWVHGKRKRVHSSYPLPYMVKRNLNHVYTYLCTYVSVELAWFRVLLCMLCTCGESIVAIMYYLYCVVCLLLSWVLQIFFTSLYRRTGFYIMIMETSCKYKVVLI